MASVGEKIGPGPGGVTVKDLIALNDEMAALVRAGVPLDRGLLAASRDFRGALGQVSGRMAAKLAEGGSLAEAMGANGRSLPGYYRAIVEAGVRSGRLSAALEGLATQARGFAETRRAIGLALLYPLIVLTVAYGFLVTYVLAIAPSMIRSFDSFHMPRTTTIRTLAWMAEYPWYWVPIIPAILAFFALLWTVSGRSGMFGSARSGGIFAAIPGLGSAFRLARTADFAELLALLVEHGVALPEALTLAGEASGSRGLASASAKMRASIELGEPVGVRASRTAGLPPVLAWVLASSPRFGPLAPALHHAARGYRGQALRKAMAIRSAVPTVLMLLIGASATLLYTTAVFEPSRGSGTACRPPARTD